MKSTVVFLMIVTVMVAEASAGLTTVVFDDFEDGDYTSNPDWIVESGTWEMDDDGSNLAMKEVNSGRIHINFPTYTYDASDPATVNLDGPEWRVTFKYSNGLNMGNNNSQWRLCMGTDAEPDAMRLVSNDSGNGFGSGNKFVFYRDASPSSAFGSGADAVGRHWYEVTFEFEANELGPNGWLRGNLFMTHKELDGTILNTGTLEIWPSKAPFFSFNRLTLDGALSGGKTWLYDDVQVEVVPEPMTLMFLGLGTVLLWSRKK